MRKFRLIFYSIIESLILNVTGEVGRRLRYLYWSRRFRRCGKDVFIDEGVIIKGAEWISVGERVWIDKYTILIAGPVNLEGCVVKERKNPNFRWEEGELIIGSQVHIGAFNIIQAHCGVYIGNKVTTSAGVKIYSLSNYPFDERNPEIVTYANYLVEDGPVSYIKSPVVILDGVWIGLDCIVLGGTIGENSFIRSNSVVIHDIPENSYASGFPAKKIRERFKKKFVKNNG